MATNTKGYVCKYEATDNGGATLWQFIVGGQPMTSANPDIAETMRLAIQTASPVLAVHENGTVIQVQIVFRYVCEHRTLQECDPEQPGQLKEKNVCETRRFARCEGGAARCNAID